MKIHVYEFLALLRRESLAVILTGKVSLGSDKIEDSKILAVVEFIIQFISTADSFNPCLERK